MLQIKVVLQMQLVLQLQPQPKPDSACIQIKPSTFYPKQKIDQASDNIENPGLTPFCTERTNIIAQI